jgi:hypothetical protein
MKKLFVISAIVAMLTVSLGTEVVAQGGKNVQATLFHAPPGTGDCLGNGVSSFPEGGFVNVHFNSQQNRLIFNFHVEGALPNTTYEVGVRCISILGDFTTNSQGEGDLTVKSSAAGIVPGTFSLGVEGPIVQGVCVCTDTFFTGPISLP